jgi:hypothetical protein
MRAQLRHHFLRRHAVAALVFVAAVLAASGVAQAQSDGVAISTPADATRLTYTSAFYRDAPDFDVLVTGSGSLAGPAGDYRLFVQGIQSPMVPGVGNAFTFQQRVWIGYEPGPAGVPPAGYPYLGFLSDPHHIQRPLLVELFHVPTNAVVARDRVVLFDARLDQTLENRFTGSAVDDAAHVQLTARGLDALEAVHLYSQPFPTLSAFNEVLEAKAAGTTYAVSLETRPKKKAKACLPYSSVSHLFAGTGAEVAVFAEASARYLLYLEAKSAAETGYIGGLPGWLVSMGLQAYLKSECVRQAPTNDTFELCVGTLEGELTDLSVGGVSATNLSFGPGSTVAWGSPTDDILADVDLGRVDGEVEGRLRDVFIRWSKTPGACTVALLPKATVDLETLLATPERAEWATCSGLEVDADSAHPGSTEADAYLVDPLTSLTENVRFSLEIGPAGLEAQTTSGKAGATFTLSSDQSLLTTAGTCGESFVNAKVDNLLKKFYPDIEAALGEAWDDGVGSTQQALALDALLRPFEIGTYEPLDHALDLEYSWLDAHGQQFGSGYDGLIGAIRTNAKIRSGFEVTTAPTEWVYATPGDTLFDGTVEGLFTRDGLNRFAQPFQFAYGLTTGLLNQVLRERSASAWLRFDWAPTWGDLGVSGPNELDPAPLDAQTLGTHVNAAFANLGTATLTVRFAPTPRHLPFTWIPPDPVAIPPIAYGRAPITYQFSQYAIDFYSDDPANPNPLRVLVDFYDEDFALVFDADLSKPTLTPQFGTPVFTFSIVESNIPGCPKEPHLINPPAGLTGCEARLEADLAAVLTPLLQQNMLGMLADVPAPHLFDAGGTSANPHKFSTRDVYTWQQRIVFYGDFERVP